jgi:flagellar hook-associated protein 1 FlgK
MADAMAHSLSDVTVPGSTAAVGAQAGFDLDTTGLLAGNTIHLTYTDQLTGRQHDVSIVRVDDPAALPLKDTDTLDPNDEVVGVDFSGGLTGAIAQLNAKFGGRIQFSNPSGNTLRVLDDGAGNVSDVNALSMTRTATALSDGNLAVPLFTDANGAYTGAFTAGGPQSLGFAGRISVNAALAADPSKLVNYGPGVQTGDASRPNFIFDQLVNGTQSFSTQTGLGSAASPYTGNIGTYLGQVLSRQGSAADNAANLAQGQAVVVSNLQQRLTDESGVSIDQEMANLMTLQTAYGANARVMSAVKQMLDELMQVV